MTLETIGEREQKAANASANASSASATDTAASAASDQASTSMDVDSAAHPVVSSVLSRFTHSLHFKYNDGCTNAVRRTIPLAHFLPL